MLKRFLEKFREIPRGAPFRDVFTAEWANAVQDCLRALAAGENITIEGDMTRNPGDAGVRLGSRRRFQAMGRGSRGRFKVTFSKKNQRLHVNEGSVYLASSEEDHQSIKPEIPVLDGVSLSTNPSWALEDITTGVVYNVWCVIGGDSTQSKMQLRKDSDAVEWEFPEENALCVAHLTFKAAAGGGVEVDGEIHQDWEDNIEWFNVNGSGSSGGSSGGDDDSSDGGGSSGGDDDDSSTLIEESDDDDSSDDSSSEEDSSGGVDCPTVEILEVLPIAINGLLADDGFNLCFSDTSDPPDGMPDRAYLTVAVVVRVGPTPPGCYPYVRASVGGGVGWTNVTVPPGGTATVTVQVTFYAYPSSPYDVFVALRHPIGFSGCAALNECPEESKNFVTPGGC